MKVRILATADVHIGRRPSRLGSAESAARYSCAQMWREIVDRAIELEVDLVALAGDLVDHENRFFEATGPFEDGLFELAHAHIPTYAVAGNHDFDVLPKIVDAVGTDHFHFLGRGGRWEEAIFERQGQPLLRLHGWSFPASAVPSSPMGEYPFAADDRLPTVGLLHADLDARISDYAPVSRAELLSRPVAAWVLGHVHRPRWEPPAAGPALLYTGSPQAMDPGEEGPHGPWLIEIHGPRRLGAVQLPMSRVRYETIEIDISGVADRDRFDADLLAAVGEALAGLGGDQQPLEQVALRLVLCGRTPLSGSLELLTRPLIEQFERRVQGATVRIDKIVNETLPMVDLQELSEKHDPTGVLARTLLALQSGEPGEDAARLLRTAQAQMAEVHNAPAYIALRSDPPPDAEDARRTLIRQARLLLDALLTPERA